MKNHLTIIVFCLGTFAYAQYEEATLYFQDGSSWKGLGKIIVGQKIKFKFSEEDKPDVWTYILVEGITIHDYYDGDLIYKYVNVKKKYPSLLKLEDDGFIKLFSEIKTESRSNHATPSGMGPQSMHVKTITYYLKKDNEEFASILGKPKGISISFLNNFKKKAKEYFYDCPGIIQRLDSSEFNKNTIRAMVEYYNNYCAD